MVRSPSEHFKTAVALNASLFAEPVTGISVRFGALGRLGDICVRLGQHNDALDYYRRIEALVEDPPAWLFIGLGNALEALGERRAALENLQRAVQLGVNSPAILKRVARLAV